MLTIWLLIMFLPESPGPGDLVLISPFFIVFFLAMSLFARPPPPLGMFTSANFALGMEKYFKYYEEADEEED